MFQVSGTVWFPSEEHDLAVSVLVSDPCRAKESMNLLSVQALGLSPTSKGDVTIERIDEVSSDLIVSEEKGGD